VLERYELLPNKLGGFCPLMQFCLSNKVDTCSLLIDSSGWSTAASVPQGTLETRQAIYLGILHTDIIAKCYLSVREIGVKVRHSNAIHPPNLLGGLLKIWL
jgi:hypothetical protein